MTKSDLVQIIATKAKHLSAHDVTVVVETIFDAMTEALKAGERVEIRGFGSLSARSRRARQGRNPRTGGLVSVPAKRVPFFTVGNELRQRINDGAGVAATKGAREGSSASDGNALQRAD